MMGMDGLKWAVPDGSHAILVRGNGFERFKIDESLDDFVTLANGNMVKFTDSKDNVEKAIARNFIDQVRPNLAGKAVILTKDLRYSFTAVETYADLETLLTLCVGSSADSLIYSGTNLGTGVGKVFKQTSGTQFQFKSLAAGSGISITNGTNDVTITSTASGLATVSVDSTTVGGDGDSDPLNLLDNAVTTTKINNNAVTLAKIQTISTNRLLGRSTAGSGNVEQLQIGSGLLLSGGVLSNSATSTADTTYDAGNGCWVTASALGVTFSTTGGTGTIVIPTAVRLRYFRVNGATADLDGSNNYKVVFNHTGSNNNTGIDDYTPPVVQVINTAAQAASGPSDAAPFTYNQSASPGTQLVAYGSGDYTIRITALNAYSDWSIIGFTGK